MTHATLEPEGKSQRAKTERVCIVMPTDLAEEVRAHAKAAETTFSAWIRNACRMRMDADAVVEEHQRGLSG